MHRRRRHLGCAAIARRRRDGSVSAHATECGPREPDRGHRIAGFWSGSDDSDRGPPRYRLRRRTARRDAGGGPRGWERMDDGDRHAFVERDRGVTSWMEHTRRPLVDYAATTSTPASRAVFYNSAPPVASFRTSSSVGITGQAMQFDSSASSDPDEQSVTLSVRWDWEGDG